MALCSVETALAQVHQEKATGTFYLEGGEVESALLFSAGDLVGMRVGFGYQTPLQALVASGQLGLSELDAVWAQGEPEAAITADALHRLHVLANVRSLIQRGPQWRFEAGPVENLFEVVSGDLVAQASRMFLKESLVVPSWGDLMLPTAGKKVGLNAPSGDGTPSKTHHDIAPPTQDNLTANAPDAEGTGLDLAGEPNDEADAARARRRRLLKISSDSIGRFPKSEEPASPLSFPAASAPLPDSRLARLILDRHAELQAHPDFFAVLGISRSAGREQVKLAFLSLAKVFHPDRLPPELSTLAGKMTELFESIRAAHDGLYDDDRRQTYLRSIESPPPAPTAQPGESAAELVKKGEGFLRRREYRKAEAHFARAYALEPKADPLAAQAWAIYADAERRSEMPRAKEMMAEALKLDASCERAHYQLGVVSRVEGNMDKAERHFREVVANNPKHFEAQQELRLMERRRKH